MVTSATDKILTVQTEITNDELGQIGTILNMYRNINMSVYKDKYMKRRVAIRMRSTHCSNASQYCELLRQSSQELDMLQKVLTIHVSQFFRNPTMFKKLQDDVIPGMFNSCKERGVGKLRFWCVGCAGGEEPFSLAILLREHFSRDLRKIITTINGTDIDAETIRTAKQAEYTAERLREVPTGLIKRYFRQNGSHFWLMPELREMVTFVQGDITKTAEYELSDLIMCRNTMIYFTRHDQEKILHGIADIMHVGGILVLGKSETLVGNVRRRFETICPVERIFRRI